MNSKLSVKDIPNFGKGVFALQNISKKELLVMFGGYVMTLEEEQHLPKRIRDYAHQIAPNFVFGINKIKEIQPVDFINHSCDPNCGFRGQIFLVAMKDIKKGEQITFDYAMVLTIKGYKFKCVCGSANCRGYVTENDWKISKLQKKYKGYFQPYLEDKIKDSA
jgi:SET domain-containing protein